MQTRIMCYSWDIITKTLLSLFDY